MLATSNLQLDALGIEHIGLDSVLDVASLLKASTIFVEILFEYQPTTQPGPEVAHVGDEGSRSAR